MALRISLARVAPMKIPSSWKAQTEMRGAITTHTKYFAASCCTAFMSVMAEII